MYKKIKRRKHRPIPFVISFELAFIEENLTEADYEEEVRKVVRENLPYADILAPVDGVGGLWEEYNERISGIIQEELSRN